MEGVAYAEDVRNAEALAEPDLLEVFGDREVTIFGVTGTFSDLAGMCPVDLSDPRVSMEAKNEFVVKAANEAGLEIEPEYQSVFTQVIEKHGLERKFTVAPVESKTEPVDEVLPSTEISVKAVETYKAESVQIKNRDLAVQDELLRQAEVAAVLAAEPSAFSVPTKASGLQAEVVLVEPQSIEINTEELPAIVFADVQELPVQEATIQDDQAMQVETIDVSPIVSEEDMIPEARAIMIEVWESELSKDEAEVYEDFSDALHTYINQANETEVHDNQIIDDVSVEEERFTPPIVGQVAERLALLDIEDKEQVAPQLKNLMGAVHGLLLLQERQADPELIAKVQEQLQKQCVELFESLGIEYDDNDIKQFMSVLLSSDFSLGFGGKTGSSTNELKDIGTHETKYLKMLASSSNSHKLLHQLLGMFALNNTQSLQQAA